MSGVDEAAIVESGGKLAIAPIGPIAIMRLVELGIEKGLATADLAILQQMLERSADRDAAQQFSRAMAAFQAEIKTIPKLSTAKIASAKGVGYSYQFADLETVIETIRPVLIRHGLSFAHDSSVDEKGLLTCICKLKHIDGGCDSASFTLPTASSAGMSEQQKIAAALTFARRYTLISVLGLATGDADGDPESRDRTPITEVQARAIDDLIVAIDEEIAQHNETCDWGNKLKPINRLAFLKYMGVEKLADLPASQYLRAVQAIEKKRPKKGA